MQFQIRDPQGFAGLLVSAMDGNELPDTPFVI